jgi:hypothetical protein
MLECRQVVITCHKCHYSHPLGNFVFDNIDASSNNMVVTATQPLAIVLFIASIIDKQQYCPIVGKDRLQYSPHIQQRQQQPTLCTKNSRNVHLAPGMYTKMVKNPVKDYIPGFCVIPGYFLPAMS